MKNDLFQFTAFHCPSAGNISPLHWYANRGKHLASSAIFQLSSGNFYNAQIPLENIWSLVCYLGQKVVSWNRNHVKTASILAQTGSDNI